MTSSPSTPAEIQQQLAGLFAGYRVSLAMYAAVKLGIADAHGTGARVASDVAAELALDRDAVSRLLRFLASLGLFEEIEAGTFRLTAAGNLLRTDPSGSMAAPILFGTEMELPAWREIPHTMSTGESGFLKAHGQNTFDHLAQPENARMARLFDTFMATQTRQQAAELLAGYDLNRFTRIADIGAGNGALMVEILRANPRLQGVVFDLPSVVEGARSVLLAEGLAERVEVVAGDFFQSVPPGMDVYLMRRIIHDWNDEQSALILTNCRRAMARGGRVLIIDRVVPDGLARESDVLFQAALADLHMMAVTGGRERTRTEFDALARRAGLTLSLVVPTPSGLHLIEATGA